MPVIDTQYFFLTNPAYFGELTTFIEERKAKWLAKVIVQNMLLNS